METRNVVVIHRTNIDSHNGIATFVAVAENEESAKQWIQDEVDHKHVSGMRYAQGKTAQWWIDCGAFSLSTVPVH